MHYLPIQEIRRNIANKNYAVALSWTKGEKPKLMRAALAKLPDEYDAGPKYLLEYRELREYTFRFKNGSSTIRFVEGEVDTSEDFFQGIRMSEVIEFFPSSEVEFELVSVTPSTWDQHNHKEYLKLRELKRKVNA